MRRCYALNSKGLPAFGGPGDPFQCRVTPSLKWPLQLGLDVRIVFQQEKCEGWELFAPKLGLQEAPMEV